LRSLQIDKEIAKNGSFLAEPGWLFPERRYLKKIMPDIAAG
jgi:hypothetical protein